MINFDKFSSSVGWFADMDRPALSQQIQMTQPGAIRRQLTGIGSGPVSGGSVRHDHPDEYRGRCAENDVLYEPLFAAFAGHDVMLYAFALCGEAG